MNGKFSVFLFLMTKYSKLLICILFYWCTDYWQFSIMIIFIFSRSLVLRTTKLIFFPVLFLKFLMSNLKGFFGDHVQGGLLPLIFFEGVYNSSHQPSEFPEGKLLWRSLCPHTVSNWPASCLPFLCTTLLI